MFKKKKITKKKQKVSDPTQSARSRIELGSFRRKFYFGLGW